MYFSIAARYRYQLHSDLYSYFDLGPCHKNGFGDQGGVAE